MTKLTQLHAESILVRAVLSFLLFLPVSSWAFSTQEDSFWHDLVHRSYEYYVPQQLVGPTPLIIDLHGHGGESADQKNRNNGYLQELADREGVIIAWPRAIGFPTSWNGGPCCFPAPLLGFDDVGYVEKIVKRLRARYNIDGSRIYAMGISNGGIMSHRLALQSNDVFAAIAPVAFQITDNITWHIPSSWYPDRAVPQLEIHAVDDELIFYNGGVILGGYPALLDSAQKGLRTWADINECNGSAVRSPYPGSQNAYFDSFNNCAQETKTQLLTGTGGHGGIVNPNINGGFNSHEEQWAFLSQFVKPGHESDRMWNGQELKPGQWLQSADASRRLDFQGDGNLVLRKNNGQVLWASNTANKGADRLVLQDDGNLVIWKDGYWTWRWIFRVYKGPQALWASNTSGSGETKLLVNSAQISLLRNGQTVWSKN